MQCPKCGSEQPAGSLDCRRCGVVFAKLRPRAERVPASLPLSTGATQTDPRVPLPGLGSEEWLPVEPRVQPRLASALPIRSASVDVLQAGPAHPTLEFSARPLADEPPEVLGVEREGWLAFGAGLGLALLLPLLPLLHFLLQPILTLSHELGHALFAWLFGYPAIPSFDFVYGGGLTHWSTRRHLLLVALPVGALLWMAYHVSQNRQRLVFWLAALGVYLFLAFRLHSLLVLYMGHGFTLMLAGVFINRALGGRSLVHGVERPLYAFLGLWMLFRELVFTHALLTDPAARLLYREGKGGVLQNDLVRIADEVLHTGLKSVARFHLLSCLLVVPLAFLAHRYRNHLVLAVRWVFGIDKDEAEDG